MGTIIDSRVTVTSWRVLTQEEYDKKYAEGGLPEYTQYLFLRTGKEEGEERGVDRDGRKGNWVKLPRDHEEYAAQSGWLRVPEELTITSPSGDVYSVPSLPHGFVLLPMAHYDGIYDPADLRVAQDNTWRKAHAIQDCEGFGNPLPTKVFAVRADALPPKCTKPEASKTLNERVEVVEWERVTENTSGSLLGHRVPYSSYLVLGSKTFAEEKSQEEGEEIGYDAEGDCGLWKDHTGTVRDSSGWWRIPTRLRVTRKDGRRSTVTRIPPGYRLLALNEYDNRHPEGVLKIGTPVAWSETLLNEEGQALAEDVYIVPAGYHGGWEPDVEIPLDLKQTTALVKAFYPDLDLRQRSDKVFTSDYPSNEVTFRTGVGYHVFLPSKSIYFSRGKTENVSVNGAGLYRHLCSKNGVEIPDGSPITAISFPKGGVGRIRASFRNGDTHSIPTNMYNDAHIPLDSKEAASLVSALLKEEPYRSGMSYLWAPSYGGLREITWDPESTYRVYLKHGAEGRAELKEDVFLDRINETDYIDGARLYRTLYRAVFGDEAASASILNIEVTDTEVYVQREDTTDSFSVFMPVEEATEEEATEEEATEEEERVPSIPSSIGTQPAKEKEQEETLMTDKGPTEIAKDILWDSFKDARDRNAFRLFSGLIEEIGRRQLGDKWPALMEDERTRPICWLAFSTLAMTLVQSSKTKLPQAELFEKVMTTAISTSMDDGQKAIIEGFLPKLKEAWDEVRSNPVAKAFIEEGEGMNLDDWKAEHGLPNTEDLTVDLETSS